MTHRRPASLDRALDFLEQLPLPPARVETLALDEADGRWLAEAIAASDDLPRFDLAAMDGYAIRSADLGPEGRARLRLAGTRLTGDAAPARVDPGEALRILTGALMPEGADRVVMNEDARPEGSHVVLRAPAGRRPHIRRAGEDARRGGVLLDAPRLIGPGEAALLRAMGVAALRVFARPRVALVSTGNELCDGPAPLPPGRIRDTNRPMLARMLAAAGAEVSDLGILRDEPRALEEALIHAAAGHDLIVTTGGASSGLADLLAQTVSRRGFLEFWKLQMRLGKPVGFGDIDDCPILVLPGNPVAAAVDFALLGRPLLARLTGIGAAIRPAPRLPFAGSAVKPAGRCDILLGRLVECQGRTAAAPLAVQGSANLAALAQAGVLIVLTPDLTRIEPGRVVEVLPLWDATPMEAGRRPPG